MTVEHLTPHTHAPHATENRFPDGKRTCTDGEGKLGTAALFPPQFRNGEPIEADRVEILYKDNPRSRPASQTDIWDMGQP